MVNRLRLLQLIASIGIIGSICGIITIVKVGPMLILGADSIVAGVILAIVFSILGTILAVLGIMLFIEVMAIEKAIRMKNENKENQTNNI